METGPQNPDGKSNIAAPLKNDTNSSLNSSLNTINIAKVLPCNTAEEILESVFDKKESFGEPIDSILNKEFTIEGFFKSQDEEDALTDIIYKKEINVDGEKMLTFPQKIKKSNTPPHLGKIGEQTSKYHKETISQHIAMVVAGVSKKIKDPYMQLVALLHDAGKRYTTGTNKKGELCFYDHEKVSAYLAAVIYRQLGFTKEDAEPYVRIIRDHMLPFRERSQKEGSKEKYRELYGDYVTEAITILNKCDLGITQEDENSPEMVAEKIKSIEEGKIILKTLKTEDFRSTIGFQKNDL